MILTNMNAKEKRIINRAPKGVQEIMKLLPPDFKLLRHGSIYRGWEADILYKNIKIKLIEDSGYISVSLFKNGKWITLKPVEDQKQKITYNQIYNLIIKNTNEL